MNNGRKYRAAITAPTTTGPFAPSEDSMVKPAIQVPTAVPTLNIEVHIAEAKVGAFLA